MENKRTRMSRGLLIFSSILLSKAFLCATSQYNAQTIALTNTNNSVIAGSVTSSSNSQILIARYALDGSLDTSFNDIGYVTASIGQNAQLLGNIVQPADQKIVAVGSSDSQFLVVRYTPTGSLDATFNTQGYRVQPHGTSAAAESVVMQRSSFLIGGRAEIDGVSQFSLFQLKTDGSLDTNFGTQGFTDTPIGTSSGISALAINSNGKIIAAGNAVVIGVQTIALARYTNLGSLDPLFGNSGVVTTQFGDGISASDVVFDNAGRVIVVGGAIVDGVSYAAIVRYLSNGNLDSSWGQDGVILFNVDDPDIAYAYSIFTQTNGNYIVAGSSGSSLLIARFSSNGILDTSFNGTGIVTLSVGTSCAAQSVAVQKGDQKIVVTGFSDNSVVTVRLNTDGSLDDSWNGTGITTQPGGE